MLATQMWLNMLQAEERERLERYRKAWAAYFGQYPPSLKVRAGSADDNVALNYVRFIVEKNVAVLFGQPFQFELDTELNERSSAERWLDGCFAANGGALFWQKLATNGSVCGHCFVKIVPAQGGYPRLINLSPEYVSVVCDPDDIDIVLRYVIQYPARGRNNERLEIRQLIERTPSGWEVLDEVSVNGGIWQRRSATVWPWSWPPIVDAQNLPSPNEYYGRADVEEDIVRLNHAINFVLSNIQRIIRFHAHPKTWGQGFTASSLKVGVDETIALPAGASLHNLEMHSDLGSSLHYYQQLLDAIHELSHVPIVAAGRLDRVSALSGVALRILHQPLLDRLEQKRLTYGGLIVELCRRLLEMAGYGPSNIVRIIWPDVLPISRQEELQAALMAAQLGVSKDTVLRELGYDPDHERSKRALEESALGESILTAFDAGQLESD